MTKKQFSILFLLLIVLLVSSFFVWQDVSQSMESNSETVSVQDSDLEEVSASLSSEKGNNTTSELDLVENIESFWPKLRSCEVGESIVYSFESEIDMVGLLLQSNSINKLDILSQKENKCEISLELIEQTIEGSQEYFDETFLDLKNHYINDYGMTEEKFSYLFNTKIKDLSQEDKNLLIEDGFDSEILMAENNEENITEKLSKIMNKQLKENDDLKETVSYWNEIGPVKQICTGEPEALIDFLNFQTSEDGSLSVSCSTNMICEYENGVECLQIAKPSNIQQGEDSYSEKNLENTLTLTEARHLTEEFVNNVLMASGKTATIVNISEEYGLYKFIAEDEYSSSTSYLTKDGRLFFGNALHTALILNDRNFNDHQLSIEEIEEVFKELFDNQIRAYDSSSSYNILGIDEYDIALYVLEVSYDNGSIGKSYITKNGKLFFSQASEVDMEKYN